MILTKLKKLDKINKIIKYSKHLSVLEVWSYRMLYCYETVFKLFIKDIYNDLEKHLKIKSYCK